MNPEQAGLKTTMVELKSIRVELVEQETREEPLEQEAMAEPTEQEARAETAEQEARAKLAVQGAKMEPAEPKTTKVELKSTKMAQTVQTSINVELTRHVTTMADQAGLQQGAQRG